MKLRDNGDGAEMFRREQDSLRLNIYACKKLDPVPFCPDAFLFRVYKRTAGWSVFEYAVSLSETV